MTASIRGHQGYFKVFQDGREVIIDTIKSVDIKQDSTMSRAFYVGKAVGEGDQTIEGWSGSIEMEVKNDVVETFIDALINNNLNGIGVSDYTFIDVEQYADGTQSTYVYFDVQFSLSKKKAGLTDKNMKTLTMQAAGRLKV